MANPSLASRSVLSCLVVLVGWAAVALAMARDGSSGGVIRTAVVTKDGVEREMVPGDKLPHFGYEG